MAAENFEKCLAITLKWEGGYSNHPDDPGGPTMRGIIQREYDAWREKRGQRKRHVRQIEESEIREIYHGEYWAAMGCDGLAAGLDLATFDAAVNCGVGRAKQWLETSKDVGDLCDDRLAYCKRLGKLWRVFGAGWNRRIQSIRVDALNMGGGNVSFIDKTSGLHAGMTGDAVSALQRKLRGLGYPVGTVDGIFGEQLRRAIILFQDDNSLEGEKGVWLQSYNAGLDVSPPMLPRRADATHKDLEAAGDKTTTRLNLLQRVFAWVFGGAAATQVFDGASVADSVSGLKAALEPLQGAGEWMGGHLWLAVAVGAVGLIALVRAMRADHVAAYQNFTYQGNANV